MCHERMTHPLFDFMLQLLGENYLLVGILNSLTLEMDLPS